MRQRAADAGNPAWMIPYLQLEREAAAICDYSPALVAGILQTPSYAAAVYQSARPQDSADEIKAHVEERMTRRELLDGPNPPSLWVILHEAALWSGVGGPDIMRSQLRHLVAVAEHPRVTVQVFPFSGSQARATPFIVIRRQDGTEVLYEETYEQGQVHDSTEAVAEARAAYDRLSADALLACSGRQAGRDARSSPPGNPSVGHVAATVARTGLLVLAGRAGCGAVVRRGPRAAVGRLRPMGPVGRGVAGTSPVAMAASVRRTWAACWAASANQSESRSAISWVRGASTRHMPSRVWVKSSAGVHGRADGLQQVQGEGVAAVLISVGDAHAGIDAVGAAGADACGFRDAVGVVQQGVDRFGGAARGSADAGFSADEH